MAHILVIGASQGIGMETVKAALPWDIACGPLPARRIRSSCPPRAWSAGPVML